MDDDDKPEKQLDKIELVFEEEISFGPRLTELANKGEEPCEQLEQNDIPFTPAGVNSNDVETAISHEPRKETHSKSSGDRAHFRRLLIWVLGSNLVIFLSGCFFSSALNLAHLLQGAGLLIPILFFLPFLVASARGSVHSLRCLFINLFLGWTVLGWFAALYIAIKSAVPPEAWRKNIKYGIGLSIFSVLCCQIQFFFTEPQEQLSVFGALTVFQALIAAHLGCTYFNVIDTRCKETATTTWGVGKWSALVGVAACSGIWLPGLTLANAAIGVGAVFELAKSAMQKGQLDGMGASILAVLAAMFIIAVVGLTCVFGGYVFYKLSQSIDRASPETKWIHLRRLSPGIGCIAVMFMAPYMIDGPGSMVYLPIAEGVALAMAYFFLGGILHTGSESRLSRER